MSTSNVFLTSDSIAYLGDFAPHKPLYFAERRLDEVTLFHPGIIEKCYMAPDKMDSDKAGVQYDYAKLTEDKEMLLSLQSMDVFAIGSILAELFIGDANALFTFQKMVSYRSGDKSVLDRLKAIEDEGIREMVAQMISLDPKERGTLKDHLKVFTKYMPQEMLDLYVYFNYALRRGEFSQPDNKLGLIRMIAPKFIDTMKEHITEEENDILANRIQDIVFHKCFPYHLSKVAILYQLKGIVSSSPLGSFFSRDCIVSFIDESMEVIQKTEYKIASTNPSSSIYLDGIQHLKESKLDFNREPYTAKDPYKEEVLNLNVTVEQTFKQVFTAAKQSVSQDKILRKFTVVSNIIETVCSLLRNLQLSQSYLIALELLDIFSRFMKSEEVIFFIFPHLQTQVELESNKIEKYYSISLFCKLVKRIKYVSKTLAKSAAYSGYVRSLIDLCKSDPFLKNQIFKHINSFIYLNILFSALGYQSKLEEKLGSTDKDFALETVAGVLIIGQH